MNKNLHLLFVASKSKNGIVAGHRYQDGAWAGDEQDVTDQAFGAVASYLGHTARGCVVLAVNGTPTFRVTVEKLNEAPAAVAMKGRSFGVSSSRAQPAKVELVQEPTAVDQWVVVTNPGDADEKVEQQFTCPLKALRYKLHLTAKGQRADVMKKLADGSLTTEF